MHTTPTKHLPLLLFTLLLTTTTHAQTQNKSHDLRPHYTPGQTTRYEIWSARHRTITMDFQGQTRSVDTAMQLEGQLSWHVRRVRSDGSADCHLTYHWLKATLTDPDGNTQTADTRQSKSDAPSAHQLFNAIVNHPIEVHAAPDGTILAVDSTEPIRRKAPDDLDPPDDTDFLESATDLATLTAAPAAAKPRHRWSADFAWNHDMGTMHHDTRYTLESVDNIEGIPIATVTAETKLDLEVDKSDMPPDMPPLRVKMSNASITSQFLFDLQRHEPLARHTIEQHTIQATMKLDNHSLTRTIEESIESQSLRIAEN